MACFARYNSFREHAIQAAAHLLNTRPENALTDPFSRRGGLAVSC
jgi:hypothetical protein